MDGYISGLADFKRIIELGELLEKDNYDYSKTPITMTEVMEMKMCVDAFIAIEAEKALVEKINH